MSIGRRALALCVGMAVVGAGGLLAQEPRQGGVGPGGPTVRRVPPHFGQVGLSQQQREAIYLIRGKYAARVAELKEQLEQLQQLEIRECESVLNPAQRAQLAARRAASGRGRNGGAMPLPVATNPPASPPGQDRSGPAPRSKGKGQGRPRGGDSSPANVEVEPPPLDAPEQP